MAEEFDPAAYVRAPIITVQSGVTLALALVDACPKNAPANVKKAGKHLKKTAEDARDQIAERNRLAGVFSDDFARNLDNEADRCWGGLRMRLSALSMLPNDKYPRAAKAAALDTQFFGAGTEFLKADYGVQSASMAGILTRIDDDGLSPTIDEVAGAEFLAAIRDVQPRYEQMVSERLRRDKLTGQALSEITRSLQAAIVNYAIKVAGTVEHDDPATAEAARVALLPIANFREAAATRDAAAATRATKAEAKKQGEAKKQPEDAEGEAEEPAEDAEGEAEKPAETAKPATSAKATGASSKPKPKPKPA